MKMTKAGGKDTDTKIDGDSGKSEWMIEIEMNILIPMIKQTRRKNNLMIMIQLLKMIQHIKL